MMTRKPLPGSGIGFRSTRGNRRTMRRFYLKHVANEARRVNYAKIYGDFIADRRASERRLINSETYIERHHVLPRSLGGGDAKENLIYLAAGDHYFAHLLLAKIYGGNQWGGVWAMSMTRDKKSIYKRRRMVQIAREKKSELMTTDNPSHRPEVKEMRRAQMLKNNPVHKTSREGQNNPMFGRPSPGGMRGKKHSKAARDRMSESRKGRKMTEKTRDALRNSKLGVPCGEYTKQKLREAHSIPVRRTDTGKVYPSIKAAEDACGANGISAAIKKGWRSGGAYWEKVT